MYSHLATIYVRRENGRKVKARKAVDYEGTLVGKAAQMDFPQIKA